MFAVGTNKTLPVPDKWQYTNQTHQAKIYYNRSFVRKKKNHKRKQILDMAKTYFSKTPPV